MKALTIRQPWASLVAAGVKTIETRGWSTRHRGRIAIHAGKVGESLAAAPDAWEALGATVGVDGYECWHNNAAHEDYSDPELPIWPFGAIVATATLRDCVRIGRCHDPLAPEVPEFALAVSWREDKAWHVVGDTAADVTDQLPLGDYSPGRWAWLLADIKPTTERCPWCLGHGVGPDQTWDDPPTDGIICCPACDGTGHCDPIPAKGRQGLWEWTP